MVARIGSGFWGLVASQLGAESSEARQVAERGAGAGGGRVLAEIDGLAVGVAGGLAGVPGGALVVGVVQVDGSREVPQGGTGDAPFRAYADATFERLAILLRAGVGHLETFLLGNCALFWCTGERTCTLLFNEQL